MAKITCFEDLTCWQEARTLVQMIYRLSQTEPLANDFRLRDQLTAASVSIMSNIAEGFARYHRKDFIRFLNIAQSSAAEVQSLLYVVLDQAYAPSDKVEVLQKQCQKTQHLILGLIRYLNETSNASASAAKEPLPTYETNATPYHSPKHSPLTQHPVNT